MPGIASALDLQGIRTALGMIRFIRYGQRLGSGSADEAALLLIFKSHCTERQSRFTHRLFPAARSGLCRYQKIAKVEGYCGSLIVGVDAQRMVSLSRIRGTGVHSKCLRQCDRLPCHIGYCCIIPVAVHSLQRCLCSLWERHLRINVDNCRYRVRFSMLETEIGELEINSIPVILPVVYV